MGSNLINRRVSIGRAGPAAPRIESFETDVFQFPTTNPAPGYTVGWVRGQTLGATPAGGGSFWLQNSPIPDGGAAGIQFQITVSAGRTAEITFYDKTSTEGNYDYFRAYLDGGQLVAQSGSFGPTLRTFSNVAAGVHNIIFAYTKDGSASNGFDTVAVDLLKVVES